MIPYGLPNSRWKLLAASFLQAECRFCHLTNSVKALKEWIREVKSYNDNCRPPPLYDRLKLS